jgi:3-mercaptopyruvate sulfurtransferase SseA
MPLRQPKRHFTTTLVTRKQDSSTSSPAQSTLYTFADVQSLSSKPSPHRILVDVREPNELRTTGKIPTAQNLPISSSADGFFLPAEEFEERFGFQKPGPEDEVIFYCKAGVRSRAAATLAAQAGFGGKVGEFPGSWLEWAEKGGEVEKVK